MTLLQNFNNVHLAYYVLQINSNHTKAVTIYQNRKVNTKNIHND